jgi:DnaK suppressor protein
VIDDSEARQLLQRERERIEGALGASVGREDDGDTDPLEAGDQAAELVESALEEGVREALEEELAAVERAERRLAEGTYGRSVESGEPIPDERLRLIPWAERTAEQQARFGAT